MDEYTTATPMPGFCSGCHHSPCVCPGRVRNINENKMQKQISELERRVFDLENTVSQLTARSLMSIG